MGISTSPLGELVGKHLPRGNIVNPWDFLYYFLKSIFRMGEWPNSCFPENVNGGKASGDGGDSGTSGMCFVGKMSRREIISWPVRVGESLVKCWHYRSVHGHFPQPS